MPRGQDDGAVEYLSRVADNAFHLVLFHDEAVHTCLEMHLAAAFPDLFAHGFDDARQAVGADVRMSVDENVGGGTKLAKDAQNFLYIASFLRAREEFSVGIGSRAALAEGVVALRIHAVFA